jgi:hypothetical protein
MMFESFDLLCGRHNAEKTAGHMGGPFILDANAHASVVKLGIPPESRFDTGEAVRHPTDEHPK